MYRNYFGLHEEPFNNTPDVKYLYLSSQHREALAHMLYGIKEKKGFITITGEIGAGKTTICRALLNELDSKTKVAIIFNSFISELELLKTINQELFLDYSSDSKKELIDQLNQFLLEQHSMGGNVVLIIDEAQNLAIQVLEQIRMLSNLETENEKLLQIVLVGQPELRDILQEEKLKQLKQRVSVHYHLNPLDLNETKEYIFHRLKIAGIHEPIVFSEEAFDLIFSYSQGVPRMINNICDRSLLAAYTRETRSISSQLVQEALDEMIFEKKKRESRRGKRKITTLFTFAAVLSLLFITVWWIYNELDIVSLSPESFQDISYTMLTEQEKTIPQEDTTQPPGYADTLERIINYPIPSFSQDYFIQNIPDLPDDQIKKTLAGLFFYFEGSFSDLGDNFTTEHIISRHYNIIQAENLAVILERLNMPYIAFIHYSSDNPELPVIVLSQGSDHVHIYNSLFDIVEELSKQTFQSIKTSKNMVLYPNYIDMFAFDLSTNCREVYQLKKILASLTLYDNALNTFVDEELIATLEEISRFLDFSLTVPLEEYQQKKLNIGINLLFYRNTLYHETENNEHNF